VTVKVLENDGIYTAYRLIITRRDDGTLRESVKHIDIPLPPPGGAWREWSARLTEDELEVGLQIFFDKWNFGRGVDGEYVIYKILGEERTRRRLLGHRDDNDILQTVQPPKPLAKPKISAHEDFDMEMSKKTAKAIRKETEERILAEAIDDNL
jgi:hypothetical protein